MTTKASAEAALEMDDADLYTLMQTRDGASLVRQALSSFIGARGVEGERYRIEHDGFQGTVIGHYKRLDGYEGVVMQQDGTKVVHVYGKKWLIAAPTPPQEIERVPVPAEQAPYDTVGLFLTEEGHWVEGFIYDGDARDFGYVAYLPLPKIPEWAHLKEPDYSNIFDTTTPPHTPDDEENNR